MRPAVVLVAITVLSACQMNAETPAAPPEDQCGAAALQGWVGGPVPQSIPAAGPVRVFGEGDAVTMDYNPQRLNILVDGATRTTILQITCG